MIERDEKHSAASADTFLARVAALLHGLNGEIPSTLYEAVEKLENKAARIVESRTTANDFERLLSENPREEKIHAFVRSHPALLGISDSGSDRVTQGLLSKFPISPDRIADFVYLSVALDGKQYPDRIDVFELKRANVALFTTHNRFSRDLNDAWMEAVESQRLIALNYPDFVRRAVKRLISKTNATAKPSAVALVSDYSRPQVRVRILIGRRATLSPEDRMRVRELAFSTNHSIAVVTYDSLLDDIRGREPDDISRWRW